MKNDQFWNKCSDGSIRKKIEEFINKNFAVTCLKKKDYYEFEDAFVEFIYENRDMISKEVDLEYQREDFLSQAKEEFGEDVEEVVKFLPINAIDNMINYWQEALNENNEYWDIMWSELSDVLTDGGISPLVGIKDYPTDEVLIYVAYLNEWYSDMPPEMQGQEPACIEEFYNNEMADEQLSEYYAEAAKKLFGNKIKGE